MYAEIPAKEADKHGPIIQADRTYVISRFRVGNAKDAFRSVPGPYMLEFTCHTKISAATEEITEPKYIYNLTPFSKLPEFINDKKNSMVRNSNILFLFRKKTYIINRLLIVF